MANRLALGGFQDGYIIGVDLWDLDLTTKTVGGRITTIDWQEEWQYRGRARMAYDSSRNEVWVAGIYDSIQCFNSLTGAYKSTIQMFNEDCYVDIRQVVIDSADDKMYVATGFPYIQEGYSCGGDSDYTKIYQIDLATRSIIKSIDYPDEAYTYTLDIINTTYDGTPHHYLYSASCEPKVIKYSLPDLTYIGYIDNPNSTGQFSCRPAYSPMGIEYNASCVNESLGYIYYLSWGCTYHIWRVNLRTFANEALSPAQGLYHGWGGVDVDTTTGNVFATNRIATTNRTFKKFDKDLNVLGEVEIPNSDNWYGVTVIADSINQYVYVVSAYQHPSNLSDIVKIRMSDLSIITRVDTTYGSWTGGIVMTSPYPPADPIDDNPDTLPDPGGDPQEITFRWETYKAIRSDESLLK